MPQESPVQWTRPETDKGSTNGRTRITWYGGIGASDALVRPTEAALKDTALQPEQVTLWNSALMAPDPVVPRRYEKMAEHLKQDMNELTGPEDREVVATFSAGLSEFALTLKEMHKSGQDLTKDQLEKLDLVIIAGAGLNKGIKGAAETIKRTVALARSQLNIVAMPILKYFPSQTAGMESLYMFPSPLTAEISGALQSNAMSSNQEDMRTVPKPSTDTLYDKLDEPLRNRLLDLDQQLLSAVHDNDKKGIKKILKQRAKETARAGLKAYSMEYDKTPPSQQEKNKLEKDPTVQQSAIALLGFRFLDQAAVLKATLTALPAKEIEQLLAAGLPAKNIKVAIPEMDVFMSLADYQQVLKLDKDNIVKMSQSTHASWVPFEQHLRDTINAFYFEHSKP